MRRAEALVRDDQRTERPRAVVVGVGAPLARRADGVARDFVLVAHGAPVRHADGVLIGSGASTHNRTVELLRHAADAPSAHARSDDARRRVTLHVDRRCHARFARLAEDARPRRERHARARARAERAGGDRRHAAAVVVHRRSEVREQRAHLAHQRHRKHLAGAGERLHEALLVMYEL